MGQTRLCRGTPNEAVPDNKIVIDFAGLDWTIESHSASQYWSYYDPSFQWSLGPKFEKALDASRSAFASAGFTAAQADRLVESGYVVVGSNVIDRYYGGLLLSTDGRSRIPLGHFFKGGKSNDRVRVYQAKSLDDLRVCIDQWRGLTARQLLFRGQTSSYPLRRPHNNPAFGVGPYGEISLLPSLWRRAVAARSDARQQFRDLFTFEWQKVLEHSWDLADIRRRVEKAVADGQWIHSAQDLEDSDDPVLHKYGEMLLDLQYGSPTSLATSLHTLLQHYGLYSPVLDLTTDIDVAIFFATHRYVKVAGVNGANSSYVSVGTNDRKSIIYVVRENATEMHVHEHQRVLERLQPLRPLRQSCVVCRSGPDAMNLAGDCSA
jgi:FRG domain